LNFCEIELIPAGSLNIANACRAHSPTNALFNLKNTLKFTLKYI